MQELGRERQNHTPNQPLPTCSDLLTLYTQFVWWVHRYSHEGVKVPGQGQVTLTKGAQTKKVVTCGVGSSNE